MAAEKWRKLPLLIDACLWDLTPDALTTIDTWAEECGRSLNPDGDPGNGSLIIPTLEGNHEARPGDFIIRGVQGEIYPCKPDIFRATYERAINGPEAD